MKNLVNLVALAVVLTACNKDEPIDQNQPVASNFNELTVPSSFNWSASEKVQMQVELQQSANIPMELAGSYLNILDANGERIALEKINAQNKAQFSLLIPANPQGYSFELAATGERWPLEIKDQVVLAMQDPLNNVSNQGKRVMSKAASVSTPPGTNMLGNADFEATITNTNVGFAYNPTTGTVDDGKWYVTDNDWSQATENGSTVFKAANNRWTHFWQLHTVNAGDSIHFTAEDWNGTVHGFLFFYADANATNSISYVTLDFNSGTDVISTIVPQNATVVSALFNLRDNAWVDNGFLSNPPAITDTDNDGVADENDDFPNDPTRAYLSYYPTVGRQTIAFEDMWPKQGDYDFNDMVVSLEADLIKDPSGNWLSATYTVALDAFGGGIESGFALQLLDANKNGMSDIIASVSGNATEDPNVTNGIIVFSDPDAVRSQYYTNTEAGLLATPDTISFTINFSSNNGAALVHDFYIFHREQRGREVHLVGFTGTAAADDSLNNTEDDVNGTYQTATGLPWAMDLVLDGENFQHPYEKIDMITAYPQFSTWASSGGNSNANWYQTPNIGDVVNLLQ